MRIYLVRVSTIPTSLQLTANLGLQDTNLARVKAAQEYLTKCDHICVVADISRALTDESLRISLHSAKSRFAPENRKESEGKGFRVAVICTKTDVSILWTLGQNITNNK